LGKAKELAFKMDNTIKLYGFPTSVTTLDVKAFVENFTDKGTISMMKVSHGKSRVPRAFTIIQIHHRRVCYIYDVDS